MNVPDTFTKKIVGAFGNEGKAWLKTLEERVQTCIEKWKISIDAPVSNLSYNFVLKAYDSKNRPVILKLGVPNFDFKNEIRTVQAYAGQGCARLLDADPELGAMLLEQLVPGKMLAEEQDEEVGLHQFVRVWKAIRTPIPTGFLSPSIMNWAEGLTRYLAVNPVERPIPEIAVRKAQAYFEEIAATSKGLELLHGDLHHENILFSEDRGWMAIDPKGVAGDPYFDVISFLINQLHNKNNPRILLEKRIDFLCENLSLERERLLKAAIALATLYACWGIEDNSEWKETYLCVQWFSEFLGKTVE